MKGKGPRIERETTITFNEVEETALIGTASQPMYRRLKKMGHCPSEDNERSASFVIPKKCVSFRKPVIMSKERLAASRKALKAARNAISSSKAA